MAAGSKFHTPLLFTLCLGVQAFQEEFDSRQSTLNTLQQTANPEDPAVLQQLNHLNELWSRVDELSQQRELRLTDNLSTVSGDHMAPGTIICVPLSPFSSLLSLPLSPSLHPSLLSLPFPLSLPHEPPICFRLW